MTSVRLNTIVYVWFNNMSLIRHRFKKTILNKAFFGLNLSHFCNNAENVDTTLIVISVLSRLFDKLVNDLHYCLILERSVSGRGGNKHRAYTFFKNRF